MTDHDPTLHDLWRLLGSMNRRMNELGQRMNERFDVVERRFVAMDERISAVDAGIAAKFGALKESIEARDFHLDDHGRRLSKLEESLPP
jgi:hypothetical protein